MTNNFPYFKIRRCPVLINVGDKSIIDDDDLKQAIESEWISLAILDIKKQLPRKSKLWMMPNVRYCNYCWFNFKISMIEEYEIYFLLC